jgi:hypothetical protein
MIPPSAGTEGTRIESNLPHIFSNAKTIEPAKPDVCRPAVSPVYSSSRSSALRKPTEALVLVFPGWTTSSVLDFKLWCTLHGVRGMGTWCSPEMLCSIPPGKQAMRLKNRPRQMFRFHLVKPHVWFLNYGQWMTRYIKMVILVCIDQCYNLTCQHQYTTLSHSKG